MDVFEAGKQVEQFCTSKGVNPQVLIMNMFGIRGNNPQEVLDNAYKAGKIPQQYYQMVNGKV